MHLPGIKSLFLLFTTSILSTLASNAATAPADSSQYIAQVVPVNWKNFSKPFKMDSDFKMCRQIFANEVRYNLDWIVKTFKVDDQQGCYLMDQYDENGIRPAASICYAAATALKCSDMNEKELGVSREIALDRATMLIKGVASAYKANRSDGKGWGDGWQTAFWATMTGQGAWMLWNELKPETKKLVYTMVVKEADRLLAPGYKVPYWTAPDGHVNTPGDTKAEENAWNSTLLQLAIAMIPKHPHVARWKQICSELMISAFSVKSDLNNNLIVDGKPVKDWLNGFNVSDEGAVINHKIVHPDYTVTVTINARSFLTQSLAGEPVSQGAQWNAPFIYRSLTQHVWPSPPYKSPGGTMYIQGEAEVYYPQGTDWSKYRFDIYYLNDVSAYIHGWDKGLKYKACNWMRIRAQRILDMQARNGDGSMFAPGEFTTYKGHEQMAAWQLGDAYLLFWLHAHKAIPSTRQSGHNWLSNF